VTLAAADVLREAAAWVWVPDDAEQVQTDEFRVIAYPPRFAHPTVVCSVHSPRPAETVLAEALAGVDALGREEVCFQGLSDSTCPGDLEALLVDRGAHRDETLSVLALDLREGVPDLDVPTDLELELVLDVDAMREVDVLDTSVFGGSAASDEQLAEALLPVLEGSESPRVLARRGGVPVGTAGHVVAGDVLRLWGAGVAAEARGTGVYRALLDHRLRAGVAAGARMALVKGRVETSAPVLLRAGFQRYGEERSYRLARG
jgi:hypothetical protein